MKKEIKTNSAPSPIGPYSQAIETKNTLFISGQVGLNPNTGKLMIQDIETETKQVMENLGAILKQANLNYHNVVKCSIFIADMKQFKKINLVYDKYFSQPYPARETVEVSSLPKNANIEISAIAIK